MTVEEAYKTLKDPKMSKLECNFKVKNIKPGNNIPGWFKKFHKEEFKPLQEAVIKFQTEPPKWFIEFANQVLARFDKLDSRIDNLVSKNNLIE